MPKRPHANPRVLLQALAEDCRTQGEHDIAEAIDQLMADIDELTSAVKAEREAAQATAVSGRSQDEIQAQVLPYVTAHLRTDAAVARFEVRRRG